MECRRWIAAMLIAIVPACAGRTETPPGSVAKDPLMRTLDLDVGESATVTLSDGNTVRIRLLDLKESRCALRGAVRRAVVTVDVDGTRGDVTCATYHLPKTVGAVQVDCPVTRGYTEASSKANVWALDKAARLRLWPAGSPWIRPGTFAPPVDQCWFASDTQMANDPCYVNACDIPGLKQVYYHYGLDFGGVEGKERVIAATDGTVVSKAGKILEGEHPPQVKPRHDVVYLRDDRGWYYRYSHLMRVDPSIELGQRIRLGDPVGLLGKEGGSGGWAHLHFDVTMPQPSGRYGITDAYAFIFDAYRRRHEPPLIAVARPHLVTWAGEPVTLEAARSWHAAGAGRIVKYEWTHTDGSQSTGPAIRHTYEKPGHYTEIVKVIDDAGRFDYDFAVVQVFDKANPKPVPPAIHAAFWPTRGLKAGDTVTFKVRTFGVRPDEGRETWEFGDGTVPVHTRSDGNQDHHAKDGYAVTTHRYGKPGHYLVSVHRTDDRGYTATGRLHVVIEP